MYKERDWHWDFLFVLIGVAVMTVVLYLSLCFSIKWLCWVALIVATVGGFVLATSMGRVVTSYYTGTVIATACFFGLSKQTNLGWYFASEVLTFRIGAFALCHALITIVAMFFVWIELINDN